ncbi:MAG: peptidoglycan editing factor PgeF [Alphaproteobacteria bacterium]
MGQTKFSRQAFEENDGMIYYDMEHFCDNAKDPVFHGFFGRRGGVSKGVYNALNCGSGSDDLPENVKKNYETIAGVINIEPEHIMTVHQVHGNACITVQDKLWRADEKPQADALVTDRGGVAIGVLTADCAPVLLRGQKPDGAPVIGAAHAGWKGAIGGVLDSVTQAMIDLGAEKSSLRACIGPCIAQVSYEVSEEFVQPFMDEDGENERFFMAGRAENRLMFDLAGYCANKLALIGVRNVYIKDLDTYFNEEDFFSYRRATHRAEKDYGRQISLIMIKD